MWQAFIPMAAQALGGSGSGSSGGGYAPTKNSTTTSGARSDIGAQDFSFGNVMIGARDKFNPWIVGGLALAALVAVALVVRR